MSKTIEKINEIEKKIENNLSSRRLKRTEAKKLLDEIKVDLETLEENAEKNYKEIVGKKVKEIQSIININIKDESE